MRTIPLVVLALVAGLNGPVNAADPTPPPGYEETPLKETPNDKVERLQQNLEVLATKYIEAEQAVDEAVTARKSFGDRLTSAQLNIARLKKDVSRYAAEVYKTGRIGTLGIMLNTHSPDTFLDRAATLEKMTARDQERLSAYLAAVEDARQAQAGLDAAVQQETANRNMMVELTRKTENQLLATNDGATANFVDPDWVKARPSPRNSSGGWTPQDRSVDDPTRKDSSRITPRTRHAYEEAVRAGFNRPTNCYRPGPSPYEHPKGRACDFSAEWRMFNNRSAPTDDKRYGSKVAYFFVKNAKALGVMYVVWWCDIWIVSTGRWRKYNSSGSRCGDDPAGDHTNHVHVSIY